MTALCILLYIKLEFTIQTSVLYILIIFVQYELMLEGAFL